jgi:hypothetical protein
MDRAHRAGTQGAVRACQGFTARDALRERADRRQRRLRDAAGRFTNIGQPANWIAADIVRIEDGRLAEHWDVIQGQATREGVKSGLPMFKAEFPS